MLANLSIGLQNWKYQAGLSKQWKLFFIIKIPEVRVIAQVGRTFALHTSNLGSILSIWYGPPCLSGVIYFFNNLFKGVIPKCRARSSPWVFTVCEDGGGTTVDTTRPLSTEHLRLLLSQVLRAQMCFCTQGSFLSHTILRLTWHRAICVPNSHY